MAAFTLSRRAEDDFRGLDPTVAARLFDAVERLATTGQGDVKKLKGADRQYRLRVGDWRVRFEKVEDGTCVILRVLHRREAYRG